MNETETTADRWRTQVRLPRDFQTRLQLLADQEHRSINNLIEVAVSEYLDRAEAGDDTALFRSALEILMRSGVSAANSAHLMKGMVAEPAAAARRVADGLRHMAPSVDLPDDDRRILVRAAGRASDLLGK